MDDYRWQKMQILDSPTSTIDLTFDGQTLRLQGQESADSRQAVRELRSLVEAYLNLGGEDCFEPLEAHIETLIDAINKALLRLTEEGRKNPPYAQFFEANVTLYAQAREQLESLLDALDIQQLDFVGQALRQFECTVAQLDEVVPTTDQSREKALAR